jgi:hypothetical protein
MRTDKSSLDALMLRTAADYERLVKHSVASETEILPGEKKI